MRKPNNNKNSKSKLQKGKTSRYGCDNRKNNGSTKFDRDDRSDCRSYTNDPAWYSADPALLKDSASISFSWPTGKALDLGYSNVGINAIPGIMNLVLHPTVGTTLNAQTPVNVASQAIYSFIRHANSGHSNYDAPDLMIYCLGMSNIYSFITWAQRNYGYAMLYDQRNKYIPDALLHANNVDAEDLRANLAQYRYWLNTFINKAASFAVPGVMPYFKRIAFVYQGVYSEGESIKDQLYQYVPDGFYKFGLDEMKAGKLDYVQIRTGTPLKVNQIITYGEALFQAMWDQEDFGIMSGDVLKAYGSNIVSLASIDAEYRILPVRDENVLNQMKNSKLLPLQNSSITQSNGIIAHTVVPETHSTELTKRYLEYYKASKLLTSRSEAPTPEDVMESTRLMWSYDSDKGEFSTGSEVVDHIFMTVLDNGNIVEREVPALVDVDAVENIMGYVYTAIASKPFHYCPEIILFQSKNADGQKNMTSCFDVDNYAILSQHDIARMNEAAWLNLFNVPHIAKV